MPRNNTPAKKTAAKKTVAAAKKTAAKKTAAKKVALVALSRPKSSPLRVRNWRKVVDPKIVEVIDKMQVPDKRVHMISKTEVIIKN